MEITIWVRLICWVSWYSVSSKHDFNSPPPSWAVPEDQRDSGTLNFSSWMGWWTAIDTLCKITAENLSSKLHRAKEDIYFDFCLLFPVSHKSILTLSCTIFSSIYNHVNTSWACSWQWRCKKTWSRTVLRFAGQGKELAFSLNFLPTHHIISSVNNEK